MTKKKGHPSLFTDMLADSGSYGISLSAPNTVSPIPIMQETMRELRVLKRKHLQVSAVAQKLNELIKESVTDNMIAKIDYVTTLLEEMHQQDNALNRLERDVLTRLKVELNK